jgi:hypothetical protein
MSGLRWRAPAVQQLKMSFRQGPACTHAEANHVWLDFDRPNDPANAGKRELLYYIGSGRRGLSYLFAQNGFLFESPVNWYGNEQRWDMAPAYQSASEIPLNLPAFTNCLRCHVSGMREPLKGTDNLYPKPAFLHAGESCECCHGPGARHIAGAAGAIAIERPGHHAYDFQPGDSLTATLPSRWRCMHTASRRSGGSLEGRFPVGKRQLKFPLR